ncbi:MAG: DUF2735 domain-containing protein [Pseudomonadota bacterium]
MTAHTHQGTAKIIPFPKGGRSGQSSGQHGTHTSDDLLVSMRVAFVEYGSGSYHDAAIRDAEHTHEH